MSNDPVHAIRRFKRKVKPTDPLDEVVELLELVGQRLTNLELLSEILTQCKRPDGSIDLSPKDGEPNAVIPPDWFPDSAKILNQVFSILASMQNKSEP